MPLIFNRFHPRLIPNERISFERTVLHPTSKAPETWISVQMRIEAVLVAHGCPVRQVSAEKKQKVQ